MKVTCPSLEDIVALSGDASAGSRHLQHNGHLWSWINGAFGILTDETLAFDTQEGYWHRTDRQIVTAYLHRRPRESHYPAADLPALARHLFRHFEGAQPSGTMGQARDGREAGGRSTYGLCAAAHGRAA